MITQIPLAIGATGTGAVTALRTTIQPPASLSPVLPQAFEFIVAATATGAVSATVLIEASQDNSSWTTAATIAVAGTNVASNAFVGVVTAPYLRANVSAISGTGAAVTVIANVK